MIRCLFTALAVTLMFATPAVACSVTSDYRVPTNLELAGKADVILVGRVVGGEQGKERSPVDDTLLIHPVSVLKGSLPEDPLRLKGLSLALDRFAVLSNPYELEGAHPTSYIGGCIRYMFPLGTTVLFFLEKDEGELGPMDYPFSRWAEDIPSANAPWPRLVSLYVRAGAQSKSEGKALLEAERELLLKETSDPVARLMAADIERQLKGPNRPWNTIIEEMMGPASEAREAAAEVADAVGKAAEAAEAAMEAVDAPDEAQVADDDEIGFEEVTMPPDPWASAVSTSTKIVAPKTKLEKK